MRFSVRLLALFASSFAVACGGSTPPPVQPEPPPPAPVPEPPTAPPAPTGSAPASNSGGGNGCPRSMAAVDAGTLWMGSIKSKGRPDEHPQHQVRVKSYCLDTNPVSVADFKKCVDNKICAALPTGVQLLKPVKPKQHHRLSRFCTAGMKDNAALPVNCIGYDEAKKYCDWKGLRLPTEPEWEFAATGGADQLDYPWGSATPSKDLLCWDRKDGPCKIGLKKPGAFGVDDLDGNVREWTSTLYGPYPEPPASGDKRVTRGASWRTTQAGDVRPQRRWAESPLYRNTDLGFRCAKDR